MSFHVKSIEKVYKKITYFFWKNTIYPKIPTIHRTFAYELAFCGTILNTLPHQFYQKSNQFLQLRLIRDLFAVTNSIITGGLYAFY